MGQAWTDTPIHFIDFEGNNTSGIIEFGVVTLQGDTLLNARTRLCGPVGRIGLEDTAVHGLDETRLAGADPFHTEWEYFAGLRHGGPLAAHFAHAENYLIRLSWPYPRRVPDFARPGHDATEWGPWIDTGRLYPQFHPEIGRRKLAELVGAMGIQRELDALAAVHCPEDRRHYHAALYDALGGALLLRQLLRRPELSEATIPWLLQMSTLDPEKRGALQQRDLF